MVCPEADTILAWGLASENSIFDPGKLVCDAQYAEPF